MSATNLQKSAARLRRGNALVQSQVSVTRNYGALLQTHALQMVCNRHGVKAVSNTEVAPRFSVRKLLGSIRWLLFHGTLDSRPTRAMREYASAELVRFAEENVRATRRVLRPGQVKSLARSGAFDIAIAGSDQVWRPAMARVLDNAFASLEGEDVTRLSYAASFGLDHADEFGPRLHSDFGRQLRQFEAVSVREQSGVALCRSEWGVDATHVLDPTMLLPPEYWSAIADRASEIPSDRSPYLLFMLLDPTEEALAWAHRLAADRGLKLRSFYPKPLKSRREFRARPGDFVMPSVESWLSGIRDADLLVTDSFHSTVFSILFKTPFFVLGNKSRGNARLVSLTNTFGLQDRQVEPQGLPARSALDWKAVHDTLALKRGESEDFLHKALECAGAQAGGK